MLIFHSSVLVLSEHLPLHYYFAWEMNENLSYLCWQHHYIAAIHISRTHNLVCIIMRTLAGMILTSRTHSSTSYSIRLSLLYSVEALCLPSHPACFTLGKETLYPVNKRQDGGPELVWNFWWRKSPFILLHLNTRTSRPKPSQNTDYATLIPPFLAVCIKIALHGKECSCHEKVKGNLFLDFWIFHLRSNV